MGRQARWKVEDGGTDRELPGAGELRRAERALALRLDVLIDDLAEGDRLAVMRLFQTIVCAAKHAYPDPRATSLPDRLRAVAGEVEELSRELGPLARRIQPLYPLAAEAVTSSECRLLAARESLHWAASQTPEREPAEDPASRPRRVDECPAPGCDALVAFEVPIEEGALLRCTAGHELSVRVDGSDPGDGTDGRAVLVPTGEGPEGDAGEDGA